MAKITGFIGFGVDLAKQAKKSVRIYRGRDYMRAQKYHPLEGLTGPALEEMKARLSACATAWARLHTWKRTRWTACAYAHWGDLAEWQGVKGIGGYTLYVKCWLEQGTEPDKQPISPCSARALNPEENAHNYQP